MVAFGPRTFRRTSARIDKNSERTQYKGCRTRAQGLFDTVVLDEGHRAKNRNTKAHTSISLLKAFHIWIITATVMQNTESASMQSTFQGSTANNLYQQIVLALLELLWLRIRDYLEAEVTAKEKLWISEHRSMDLLLKLDALS